MSKLPGLMLALILAAGAQAVQAAAPNVENEDYVREPVPPGIRVTHNERDGAMFADQRGHTLYTWPFKPLRIGEAGDRSGASSCTNQKYTENGGFQEPYPGGLLLPDLENRRTCEETWPPLRADAAAAPVGNWTVITREDGSKQWAYRGQPVYTSFLDRRPGDVLGVDRLMRAGAGIAPRYPLSPAPNVPPGFDVVSSWTGRLLTVDGGKSVYTRDADATNKSSCGTECERDWKPVLAPSLATARGEFTVFERAPNVKQWAFRGKPLYTYLADRAGRRASLLGSDVPGWRNVYTQKALPPPKAFTLQDSPTGQLVADGRGKTIYFYVCYEDTKDNLACDHPDAPQDYRLAVCGGLDPVECNKTFPYVLAERSAKSESALWSVITVDPLTGRRAAAGQQDALTVWAYRERPVYTYVGDEEPGDFYGDRWGEKSGSENGFFALVLREDN